MAVAPTSQVAEVNVTKDATLNDEQRAHLAAIGEELDAHVREIVAWHFSPETGTPFWLDWARDTNFDASVVRSFDDLVEHFSHFQDEWLRDIPNERFIPRAFAGKPFNIFETGGTTGMPKQRVGWEDYKHDYEEFSEHLRDEHFPRGANWLMVGPTGPRRLRLAIEHLANVRGGACYFVDLDPRWVKKLLAAGKTEDAESYKRHVIEQAVTILKGRNIRCLFTTPTLLEALADRVSLSKLGIAGCFCGGTSMTPQYVRFLVEEVCEGTVHFEPTYGNTLMGLARSKPLVANDNFSITYYAPMPRAVLRIVNPERTEELVPYGQWGRVELTTLTREFFMPRFLERDEAQRRVPAPYFGMRGDGVGDVRPFQAKGAKAVVEGVY